MTRRFFPNIGNHDYDAGIQGYFDYFDLPGNERYYTYRHGPIEFFRPTLNCDGSVATSVRASNEVPVLRILLKKLLNHPFGEVQRSAEGGIGVISHGLLSSFCAIKEDRWRSLSSNASPIATTRTREASPSPRCRDRASGRSPRADRVCRGGR